MVVMFEADSESTAKMAEAALIMLLLAKDHGLPKFANKAKGGEGGYYTPERQIEDLENLLAFKKAKQALSKKEGPKEEVEARLKAAAARTHKHYIYLCLKAAQEPQLSEAEVIRMKDE